MWTPLLSIEVPKNLLLKANGSRGDIHTNASKVRTLRYKAKIAARNRLNLGMIKPITTRIDLLCVVRLPRRVARCDAPNLYPTIKPIIDGFTDAGLWEDDDYKHIRDTIFRYNPTPTGVEGTWTITFHTTPAQDNTDLNTKEES